MEILTVPTPLEYMLGPCHPKYLRSPPFPFGADCEGDPQPLLPSGLYVSDCCTLAIVVGRLWRRSTA